MGRSSEYISQYIRCPFYTYSIKNTLKCTQNIEFENREAKNNYIKKLCSTNLYLSCEHYKTCISQYFEPTSEIKKEPIQPGRHTWITDICKRHLIKV